MAGIGFPLVLRRGPGGPIENRANAQSGGNSEISHENEFHQFHFLSSFSARRRY